GSLRHAAALVVLASALLAVLIACGGGNQPPARGSLAGSVVVGGVPAGVSLHARPSVSTGLATGETASDAVVQGLDDASSDFVPGEVVVGFRSVASADGVAACSAVSSLDVAGVRLSLARSTPVLASALYRVAGLSKE